MAHRAPTPAVEDYLKAIYALERRGERVSTTRVAQELGVAPASASTMMKKLADMRLVTRQAYRGVVLSEAGERVALEVVRHHRLVERFLADVLGMRWDEVHDEAEKWEHVLSEDVEGRIDAALGHPTTD
ncbi:MAG: metal-dependent transcriptional regulator, partial [Actinomycetota bacterium]|nr:metal-dependent transcriptional regulator [Actinomycetota bacterium]